MSLKALGWIALTVAFLIGTLVGTYGHKIVGSFMPMMAYGLDEKDNSWNRIRVNEKGQVLCVKD